MTVKEFSNELYKLYGNVTRARGCFLYTKKGVRLTDLYQENGRAILGWDAGNAFTHLKNVLSRGQVGSFICEDKSRLNKALNCLFISEREIFFFSDKISAIKAGVEFSANSTTIYKPWQIENKTLENIDSLVYEPVLPWTDAFYILAVKKDLIANNSGCAGKVAHYKESSIIIPFAIQAAITRATYNLIEALKTRKEKEWFIYDSILTKYWVRKGPYLQTKVPEQKYDDFILHCLKLGIAINPDANGNSIVPYGADKGVFTLLKNSPFIY